MPTDLGTFVMGIFVGIVIAFMYVMGYIHINIENHWFIFSLKLPG